MSQISLQTQPYNVAENGSKISGARPREFVPPSMGTRKIRVLLVITRLTIGGDTNVVLDIASRLNPHLFQVDLAVGPVPPEEVDLTHLAHERSIPVKYIPALVNNVNPWTNLKAVEQLYRLIRAGNYDVVHTHSSVAGVIGRLAAFLAGVPVIVHHVHGWGLREDMSFGVKMMYLSLERLCALCTNRLIAVSKATIRKGLAYRICREDKFTLIYNGITLQDFRPTLDKQNVYSELGLDPRRKTVGMIGRLDAQKNPLDFIRSASMVANRNPEAQFLIAGEGRLHSDCEALVRELNLQDRFFLLGFRNDIGRILSVVDIVASTSLWDGLPVVFQEAMSAGRPIVANDIDGASDVVIDGRTGYLVPPRQNPQMAERILYLLDHDDVCQEMGATARKDSERFSTDQMINGIECLYCELSSVYAMNLERPIA
jgi:glycosyltransferase involved in cell wall biosynthesis